VSHYISPNLRVECRWRCGTSEPTTARTINRLTALQVERCRHGKLHDGGGLYFLGDQRAWAFRYGAQGRNWHGLGPLHTVGLAEAREKARQCRTLLLDGASPLAVNRERLAAAKLAAQALTFTQCAKAYHEAHRSSWRNQKHASDWLRSLQTHAFPVLGALPITAIDTALLLKVLEPIWTTRTVTARRVRQRIEVVLDWAKARELREGENPARLRGHLGHLLPQRKRIDRKHHAALPYADLPGFMAALRKRDDIIARCLEFTILTAVRVSGSLGARWGEIDLRAKLWTIPRTRMKLGREHRVPLSAAAIEILRRLPAGRPGDLVFPGRQRGSISATSLWNLARELAGTGVTTHGFRSSFRDWAAEQTDFPDIIAEQALAHTIGDETARTYRRTDLLVKRAALMEAWGRFCKAAPVKREPGKVAAVGARRHG
jgi:integrase